MDVEFNPEVITAFIMFTCTLWLTVLILILIGVQLARRYDERVNGQARQLGFSLVEEAPEELLDGLQSVYHPADEVRLNCLAKKMHLDQRIYLCDIPVTDYKLEKPRRVEYRMSVVQTLALDLPYFLLVPRKPQAVIRGDYFNRQFRKNIETAGLSEIDIDLPDLKERYMLFSREAQITRKIFVERAVSILMEAERAMVRGMGDLLIYSDYALRGGDKVQNDDLHRQTLRANQLANALSEAVKL